MNGFGRFSNELPFGMINKAYIFKQKLGVNFFLCIFSNEQQASYPKFSYPGTAAGTWTCIGEFWSPCIFKVFDQGFKNRFD